LALIALLMVGTAATSLGGVDAVVRLYQWIGPLGSIALGLLFLFSTFALLAVLSQKSGFPALSLLVLAIVISAVFPVPIKVTAIGLAIVCAFFAWMALLSRLWAVAIVAALLMLPGIIALRQDSKAVEQNAVPAARALQERFKNWFEMR